MLESSLSGYFTDFWGLGIILFEMSLGYTPFKGKNDKDNDVLLILLLLEGDTYTVTATVQAEVSILIASCRANSSNFSLAVQQDQ